MTDKSKILLQSVLISASLISAIFFITVVPEIDPSGDSPSYIEAMKFLEGSLEPVNFNPYRILTTFLGLNAVLFISKIINGLEPSWLVMNTILYFLSAYVFYKIIYLLWKNENIALVSTLFLIGNYAIINFGLHYYMDIGGWFFYILSLFLLLKYADSYNKKDLYLSALAIGFGGLFKEYAYLAAVAIFCFVVWENWRTPLGILKKGIPAALIALIPTVILYYVIYSKFGYSYLDWLGANQEHYVYSSRITEYIKSLGSLYNLLAIFVLGGAYYWIRQGAQILSDRRRWAFIISAIISALPIFLWPAITQRILFITVPAAILIASFFFKKFERSWIAFIFIAVVYVVISFLMDPILLNVVNLPF
jgi:hypothetical protein